MGRAGQGQRGEAGNERAVGLWISQLAGQRPQLGAGKENCAAGQEVGERRGGGTQDKVIPCHQLIGEKTEAMIYVDTQLL